MRLDTELSVHLDHLKSNIELLREKFLRNNQIIFMVKANAYGHGLAEVTSFANQNCGINNFGVASLGEATFLREKLPDLNFNLWVFSELNLKSAAEALKYEEMNIFPVISDLEDLKIFLARESGTPLVLKFNTGMNRLGMNSSDLPIVAELLKKFKRKEIFHLMTHFSSSYFKLKQNDRTHKQYEEFCAIKTNLENSGFQILGSSVSNSGALEQKFGLEETHVRPGLMLYGPQSVEGSSWNAKIISSLKSRIIQLRTVRRGTPIGYGGHICHADGEVAYLPLGYGDGFLTQYSGLELSIDQYKAKVLGRVNMDLTQLFFEESPQYLKAGLEIKLWDETQGSIDRIAKHAKTIPYQIFTSISSRVSRRYYS